MYQRVLCRHLVSWQEGAQAGGQLEALMANPFHFTFFSSVEVPVRNSVPEVFCKLSGMRTEQLLPFPELRRYQAAPWKTLSCWAPWSKPQLIRMSVSLGGWEMFCSHWHLGQVSREPRVLQVSWLQCKHLWVQLPLRVGHVKRPRKDFEELKLSCLWNCTSERYWVRDRVRSASCVYFSYLAVKTWVSVRSFLLMEQQPRQTNIWGCSTGSALLHRKWGAQLERREDKGGDGKLLHLGFERLFVPAFWAVLGSGPASYPSCSSGISILQQA